MRTWIFGSLALIPHIISSVFDQCCISLNYETRNKTGNVSETPTRPAENNPMPSTGLKYSEKMTHKEVGFHLSIKKSL